MKKVFSLCLAFILAVSFAACSPAETPEQRIERVLTQVFTGPDDETRGFIERQFSASAITFGAQRTDNGETTALQAASEEFAAYLKTKFTDADFTEKYQKQFCGGDYFSLLQFPTVCALEGITLTVDRVQVESESESSRTYSFSVDLQLEKETAKAPFTQKGKVQVDEDGRISWISADTDALCEALQGL